MRPSTHGAAGGANEAAAALPGARFVWLDGRLVPLDEPHLSVTDRGFQLGDGIFESLRARRGIVIELAEHLSRLHESAAAIAIHLPPDAELVRGMLELLDREGLAEPGSDARAEDAAAGGAGGAGGERRESSESGDSGESGEGGQRREGGARGPGAKPGDAALRITVSRGPIGPRGLLPPGWESVTATIAIQAWPYAPPASRLVEHGVSAILSRVRRDPASPLAGIKSTSRADHVYAKLEAERAGVDEAIFPTVDGHLSEATTANLFLVRGDRLLTPPLSAAILAGTTRTWLIERASAGTLEACGMRLRVEDRPITPGDVLAADEAFLSSSVAGILPLTQFERRAVGTGRPGPITLELRCQRDRWFDEAALAAIRGRPGHDGPERR